MGAGFLFGFRNGVVISLIGRNLGNLISIYGVRHFFRTRARDYVSKRFPNFLIVERIVCRSGNMGTRLLVPVLEAG